MVAPLPKGVEFKFENGAVPYVNDQQELMWAKRLPGFVVFNNSITSVEPDQFAVATLVVKFEQPMWSMVFLFTSEHKNKNEHAEIQVHYRAGAGPWHPVTPGKRRRPVQATVPLEGANEFRLRARIRVKQAIGPYPTAGFLTCWIDEPHPYGPCFAIVADPDPDVAKLPK